MAEIAELARRDCQTLEAEHARGRRRSTAGSPSPCTGSRFEGQILHTDAWPGAFDAWTVDTLRAVQEAVDRILSGQDIRYYPTES